MFVFHLNNSKIDDVSICDSIAGTSTTTATIYIPFEASPSIRQSAFSSDQRFLGRNHIDKHKGSNAKTDEPKPNWPSDANGFGEDN